jgi:hypothetical protein
MLQTFYRADLASVFQIKAGAFQVRGMLKPSGKGSEREANAHTAFDPFPEGCRPRSEIDPIKAQVLRQYAIDVMINK